MREPSANEHQQQSGPPQDRAVKAPSISLPKGGGAIQGIGEKFSMNPATGTASFSIPLVASPGRADFGPKLTLAYDSGAGNGPFGLGWQLGLPSITRKTSKGLPRYRDGEESDVFLLSDAEDLVPELAAPGACGTWNDRAEDVQGRRFEVRRYRPRIEGPFARIERWRDAGTGETYWRSISRENVTSLYGRTPEARISDPEDPTRTFQWMLERSWDDKGNVIVYRYEREHLPPSRRLADRHRSAVQPKLYPRRILYGNRHPCFVRPDKLDVAVDLNPSAWLFELVFDYAREHDPRDPLGPRPWSVRQDPFSTYNATFEIRTWRLCHRVLMFHRFDELAPNPYLVYSTSFTYEEDPVVTYLASVTQSGHRWDGQTFTAQSQPPLSLDYERLRSFQSRVEEIDAFSLQNLPAGLEGGYQLLDLDGEGIAGILVETDGAWLYKRNLGEVRRPPQALSPDDPPRIAERPPVRFAPVQTVAERPNLAQAGKHQFLDLAGDGQIDLVLLDRPAGFFARTSERSWEPFRPFEVLPNLDLNDPSLRFIDLTGDGHADVLLSEDHAFVWHESLAERGFGDARWVAQALDEEKGPAVVFREEQQTVFLADMSGDGLQDLVRVRNGEVCYWPNLGYGRFGAKIAMEASPWFELPEQFDPRRLRLGDLDGSGPADLLYIRHDRVSIWRNQAGNGWRSEESLPFPGFHTLASVSVADLLGRGTSCLVWSSRAPGDRAPSLRYIDLVGPQKPHLLRRMTNNLGAETHLHYASSTKFYLADRLAGRPWITQLPFPVHVCEKVETFDRVSRNHFVSRYAFHHGYFDGVEREFRGFGMVEQWDTESLAALSVGDVFPAGDNVDPASHLPPALTRTWFHTGVFVDAEHVSNYYAGLLPGDAGEYYREPGLDDAHARALLLDDTILPGGLTLDERREACRALKGSILRQEVYALDGSPKAGHPYSVSERNYAVRLLQPRGVNRFAVFLTHPRETLDYHYERNPADPRAGHSLTLEVDAFGNVLKAVTVGYGRRRPDPALPPRDREEQTRTWVTYTESSFTHPIVDLATAYRAPLPAETRTFELTGYPPTGPAGRFRISDFVRPAPGGLAHIFDGEVAYEEPPGAGRQRRPIEHARTCYRPDDFGAAAGDPLALLPVGRVEPLAMAGESYQLAFTPGLLAKVYRRGEEALLPDPVSVLAADLAGGHTADRGGYVDLDGDGHWWIPSGRMFHSPGASDDPATEAAYAREHFVQAQRYRDPFGEVTTVTFDAHDLLTVETCDPLGNRMTAGERDPSGTLVAPGLDYRVLQPHQVMDSNRNRTAVAFDTLGMVVGTAVLGKPEEHLGDSLAGFDPDLTEAAVEAHFANPFAEAHAILGSATSRLVYDLFAYARTKGAAQPQPAVVYTMARETHAADLAPGERTKIQHSFSYSDGFGREIQKKIQAEPARLPDGSRSHEPRWVGSGWTIFNNKGKPVRKYEPFFSDTHRFEFARRVGVSPVLFYDPVERVVATLHPNDTYEKAVFDPWRHVTWDRNDTVLGDPRTDPDIRGFTASYFASLVPSEDGWRTWYEQRRDGALSKQEQIAARKTAAHAETPTVAFFDSLGREFRSVADNGVDEHGGEQKYATRTYQDIEGNEREVVDALDRVVMRYDYDMLGQRIHQASMDAGERWTLNHVAGKPIVNWDSRDHRFRTAYDPLRRPTESFLREGSGTEVVIGRTVYGETGLDPEANNQRGKVVQVFDQAGVVTSDEYDFKGNLLRTRRQLAQSYKTTLDWSADVPLEAEIYTSRTRYDALNRPVELTSPDNSVIRHAYNEANLLERVDANLRGAREDDEPVWTPFVTDVDYDAKGQRALIDYGNGVRTTYTYDPLTFRLVHLLTRRNAAAFPDDCPQPPPAGWPGCAVQNLSYTYDPTGNITHIHDDAQQTLYFRNKRVEPSADYTYDAIYRLIEATGREHLGQAGGRLVPDAFDRFSTRLNHPGDGQAMATYVERYVYDAVGNIGAMAHRGNGAASAGWTHIYSYEERSCLEEGRASNRLSSTTLGAIAETYHYDGSAGLHGNITGLPHLSVMQWDFRDQLQATAQQRVDAGVPEITWYVYDSRGHRVRKVTECAVSSGCLPTRMAESVYLGDFEVHRDADRATLDHETLHIIGGTNRIALVETRRRSLADEATSAPLTRYQCGNHLGSVTLELDAEARILSYEEYLPYGGTSYQAVGNQTETPKRYRFTRKERDRENGFYYHGARYFMPWLGRWASCDPAGLVDGTCLYEYCRGNPIKHSDPSGRATGDQQRTIRKGDTYWSLARASKGAYSVDDLKKWNPGVDWNKLRVGSHINIAPPDEAPGMKETAPAKSGSKSEVSKGGQSSATGYRAYSVMWWLSRTATANNWNAFRNNLGGAVNQIGTEMSKALTPAARYVSSYFVEPANKVEGAATGIDPVTKERLSVPQRLYQTGKVVFDILSWGGTATLKSGTVVIKALTNKQLLKKGVKTVLKHHKEDIGEFIHGLAGGGPELSADTLRSSRNAVASPDALYVEPRHDLFQYPATLSDH